MRDNAREAERLGLNYWPFVETPRAPARGLLARVAARAALVVTDDFPCFVVPDQGQAFARRVSIPVWAVGSNGVVPLSLLQPAVSAAAHLRPRIHAGQRELAATGVIHNDLRMLWGKKVIEWSRTPEEAYHTLEHLNNKYALDGRDPNSYTGILWCFGLFDRPWAPERPVLGRVRYMSSENTARKFRIKPYLEYVESLAG